MFYTITAQGNTIEQEEKDYHYYRLIIVVILFAMYGAGCYDRGQRIKSLKHRIIFEKENISSLDGDGELMLTILSSFAQEESENVSDNIKWRYKFFK